MFYRSLQGKNHWLNCMSGRIKSPSLSLPQGMYCLWFTCLQRIKLAQTYILFSAYKTLGDGITITSKLLLSVYYMSGRGTLLPPSVSWVVLLSPLCRCRNWVPDTWNSNARVFNTIVLDRYHWAHCLWTKNLDVIVIRILKVEIAGLVLIK